MNHLIYIIVGILLFAIATSIIYVMGLKKSIKQEETLIEMLYNNGARQVIAYLKKHDSITKKDIENIVTNVKASEFHSKKRAVVDNQKEFTNLLVDFMLQRNLIVKDSKVYRLPKGE